MDLLTLFFKKFAKKGLFPRYALEEIVGDDMDSLLWEVFMKWKKE